MAAKNRNTGKDPEDFLRYREDSLTGDEKNAFERKLQKDPFAAEAEEGFSSVDPESLRKDLGHLGRRLHRRTTVKNRFLVYRFAASLVIILGIASVFIIIERTRKTGITESIPEPFTIAESRPIAREKGGEPETDDISPPSPPPAAEKKADAEVPKVESTTVQPDLRFAFADTLKKDMPEEEPVMQPVIAREAEMMAEAAEAPVPEMAKALTDTRRAKALNTGGAEVAEKSAAEKKSMDYSLPLPEGGSEDFERYIRENIRLPEGFTTDEKQVVELSFVVKTDGRPDRFSIIKSPGKQYSDEAIRLVKEGPDWIPARREGKIISETARLTIDFRKYRN